MNLDLNHIKHIFHSIGMRICYLCVLVMFLYCQNSYGQVKNEDDLKKQANNYFEEDDYNSAYKLYAQLVSLYPKDPEYNYRLGVCMLFTEPDKKKPFSYLLLATKNPKDAPKDAKFYLAKTYHINYKFDEALKLYTEYKDIGSPSSIKKLQVDKEIEACKNGKRLLSNLSDLVIINKKQLNEADYFRSYDVSGIGGKLLVKPDEFKTPYDKKKKDKSVMYLPKNGERLYFSSYGEKGEKGRDIYFVTKLSNGTWGAPQALPSSINTEYDEDYPFLHPNGKTLYFSSKGHNSMGGYDVFKSEYDEQTQTWGKPVNAEFPINSPDDDILFVTDSLEKTAYFSTGRYSPYGKIDVLKINTERRPMNLAVIKGTCVKEEASQSLKSKITIKNIANGDIVGTYQAQDNGDYNMELPNGGKFIFTVETPGIATQSESIQIPTAYSLKPYKQVISYDNKILKIINYFDGQVSDDSYSMMIDLIEKKAKLEVNETEPYNNELKDAIKKQSTVNDTTKLSSVITNNPTVTSSNENPTATNTNQNLSNEQLLNLAKEDAKEAGDEALKLKQEAQDAFGLATQKQNEAAEKQIEADKATSNANSITEIDKKNEELAKANELQEDAKIATNIANLATNLAKKLEVDATQKQKEADLTNQYIKQLQDIIKNKNNKEALVKLEQTQNQLDSLSKQKNQSDELYNSIKAESELKSNELKKAKVINTTLSNEINVLKNEAKSLDTDLKNESDKAIKDNIAAQIRELNTEIDLKNEDLASNNKKVETLNNEVEGLTKELEIANKILNEKTDAVVANSTEGNPPSTISNTLTAVTNNTNASVPTYETITSNYNNQLNAEKIDPSNKEDLVKQNTILNNYNKEIKDLITVNNNKISTVKDATEKKKLNEEITRLEKMDSDNSKQIADNANKIKQLEEKTLAVNTTTNVVNTNTVVSNNPIENVAVTTNTITIENNTNDTAANATNSIVSNATVTPNASLPTNASNVSVDNLLNEAEALNNKAYEQRKESATKTGDEKENLLKEAVANEKLAIDKKLEATVIQQQQNTTKFATNSSNLKELQKLTATKTSDDISLANMLADEAAINFKQAEKLRQEANNYPNGSAKIGGLNNAEEKESEALAKQEKAITILSKLNPSYKLKTLDNTSSSPKDSITTVSTEDPKILQEKAASSLASSKSNQNELKLQADKLVTNPTFNNPANKTAQEFKKQSDDLNAAAKTLIEKSLTAPSLKEKSDLLSQANEKEKDALQALDKANASLIEPIVSNTATTNNTVTSNSITPTNANSENPNNTAVTNTLAVTSNSETINANTENTNPVVSNTLTPTASTVNPITNNSTDVYANAEAVALKKQATEKINEAIKADKLMNAQLDSIAKMNARNISSEPLNQTAITSLVNDADKLNDEAYELRKLSATQTGEEKDKTITAAKKLEEEAINKKVDAAIKQQQFNVATYEANKQSLEELQEMAKGKNITELSTVDMQINEANLFLKQSEKLREEANAYPSDAAKLGGYNNAEEKETQAIEKQNTLLATYKKYFSNYVPKQANTNTYTPAAMAASAKVKTDLNANNLKYADALLVLSQANEKEYTTRVNTLPKNLTNNQKDLKLKAQTAYTKNQNLITQANQTKDPAKKKSLLIEANQSAQQSIDLLNQAKNNVTNPNTNSTTTNSVTSNTNPTNNVSNNTNAINNTTKLNVDGLEIKNTNAYNESKPIPIDEKMPDGLIFKVQIGAFKTPLPNTTFKGLTPVSAQTTPSGYIRYMAGNFEKFQNANAVKNDLKNLGYRDAFVVAYYNGKRINLNEASEKARSMGQSVDVVVNASAGIPPNANIPKNFTATTNTIAANNQPAIVTKELEKINGLLFTVQIGIFGQQAKQSQLYNLKPIYTEKLPNGSYRYTAGIYNQPNRLLEDKRKVVELGIKDAFVTAYYNAKRIPFTEGKKIQAENANLIMESENPIIFSEETSVITNTTAPTTGPVILPTTNFTPRNVPVFSNGVTQGPTPTPENGVKADEAGISYKVQIGAYKNQVPNDVASKFMSIKTWPVNNTSTNGLYIYTIGNFTGITFAKKLKDEVVAVGISDAFVTVYKDGKKLYGAEAAQYLTR